MSSFSRIYTNKKTGESFNFFCIDDYFGSHKYGFKHPVTGKVYPQDEFFNEWRITT